jgi:hypothetical protein
VLLLVVGAAYFPALFHMHRGDQWVYLLETIDCRGLWDSFCSTYSFNRTNRLFTGDTGLFRPALFFFLGLQKYLFGTNVILWQAVGIVLHATICLVVLAILFGVTRVARLLRPSPAPERGWPGAFDLLPHAMVFFFATNANIIDAVIWSHLSGYLLFYLCVCVCLLLSLRILEVALSDGKCAWFSVSAAWLLCLLSAFLHELGQLYALFLGLFVTRTLTGRAGLRTRSAMLLLLAFTAILLVYQGVNLADRLVHQDGVARDPESGRLFKDVDIGSSAARAARLINFTVLAPFFSPSAHIGLGKPRPAVAEVPFYAEAAAPLGFLSVLTLAICLCWGALAGLRAVLRKDGAAKGFLFVLGGMLALYVGITVLGRMNLRPHPAILSANSYYAYFPLLVFLVAFFAALRLGRLDEVGGGRKAPGQHLRLALNAAAWSLIGGFVVLGAIDARKVYLVNKDYAKHFRWERSIVSQLATFIARHRNEPGFSFAYDLDRGDREGVLCELGVPIVTVLFRPYEDEWQPRYVVWFRSGKLRHARHEPFASIQPVSHVHAIVPRLVEPGLTHNVWQYHDRFYGVLRSEGPYGPAKHHCDLIEGATVSEVQRKLKRETCAPRRQDRQE